MVLLPDLNFVARAQVCLLFEMIRLLRSTIGTSFRTFTKCSMLEAVVVNSQQPARLLSIMWQFVSSICISFCIKSSWMSDLSPPPLMASQRNEQPVKAAASGKSMIMRCCCINVTFPLGFAVYTSGKLLYWQQP